MSFLNSLFQNETFKNMALGTLKKEMTKNGIKYVVIDMQENGELNIIPYSSESKPMVLGADAVNKTRQILEEQDKSINALSEQVRGLMFDEINHPLVTLRLIDLQNLKDWLRTVLPREDERLLMIERAELTAAGGTYPHLPENGENNGEN